MLILFAGALVFQFVIRFQLAILLAAPGATVFVPYIPGMSK